MWSVSPRFLFIAAQAAFLIAMEKERARRPAAARGMGKESVWREDLQACSAPLT